MAPQIDFKPLISIITGTYNSSAFIGNLIRSIHAQTYTYFEWLLVDDGSTDDTLACLESLSQRDARVRLFRKEPEGSPALTRNEGIRHAKGALLAFCDHDDFWVPQKLEIQIDAFKRYPEAAIIHTARAVWGRHDTPTAWPVFTWSDKHFARQSAKAALANGCKITHSSTMIPRKLMEEIGRFNGKSLGVDDYHAYLRLAPLGSIVRINLPLTYYGWHQQNLSHVKDLFARGFTNMAAELKKEGAPAAVVRNIEAQAWQRWGVVWLDNKPGNAIPCFFKSMMKRMKIRTLALFFLAFCLLAFSPELRRRCRICLQNLVRPLKNIKN